MGNRATLIVFFMALFFIKISFAQSFIKGNIGLIDSPKNIVVEISEIFHSQSKQKLEREKILYPQIYIGAGYVNNESDGKWKNIELGMSYFIDTSRKIHSNNIESKIKNITLTTKELAHYFTIDANYFIKKLDFLKIKYLNKSNLKTFVTLGTGIMMSNMKIITDSGYIPKIEMTNSQTINVGRKILLLNVGAGLVITMTEKIEAVFQYIKQNKIYGSDIESAHVSVPGMFADLKIKDSYKQNIFSLGIKFNF